MNEQIAIQRILHSRLTELQAKNPQYSVRAFAKRVGVTPGTLSLILLGKRRVSHKLASKIADQLALDPQERSEVLPKIELGKKPRSYRKQVAAGEIQPGYLQLTADQFQLIADWKYFAILNLIPLSDFQNDSTWIAGRLGISIKETDEALERLKRLEMIAIDAETGRMTRTQSQYRSTDDIASVSLRRSHFQTLDLASQSLEKDSVQERDFTWITFAMNPEKMSEAKILIRKFQDELSDLLEATETPAEVYRMAIQLFPLTKTQKPKR